MKVLDFQRLGFSMPSRHALSMFLLLYKRPTKCGVNHLLIIYAIPPTLRGKEGMAHPIRRISLPLSFFSY
ncbi:hypothetical protein BVRB_4g071340 [Beta vulgaris subsp. vulgaris]|nr:hypothetical protein BVRB_4g071340 [Beta vulgaris subsp. vulgaris]